MTSRCPPHESVHCHSAPNLTTRPMTGVRDTSAVLGVEMFGGTLVAKSGSWLSVSGAPDRPPTGATLGRVNLDAYRGVKARVADLVGGADVGRRVPSTPAWTIREVVAHLTGLCEDWVGHRLDGYASPAWTNAQVARFASCSVPEVLNCWDAAIESFAALPDDPVMGPPARWAFGDAVTHEADLRGALGLGRVPDDAVAVALKGAIGRWRQVLAEAKAPPLLLRAPDLRDWWLGTPDDAEAVVVEVPAYEVFRALAGRRSEEQVRSWRWSRDPDPYLTPGLAYPFSWATTAQTD